MPEHLHWLMTRGEKCTLSAIVSGVKSMTAHRIGNNIWQPGFHDHAVRRETDLLILARYVVANPLRAGWVRQLGDYSHWDAIGL